MSLSNTNAEKLSGKISQQVNAIIRERRGATRYNARLAKRGMIPSFSISFTPSATGCNKPKRPIAFGPWRRCTDANTRRSQSTKNATGISVCSTNVETTVINPSKPTAKICVNIPYTLSPKTHPTNITSNAICFWGGSRGLLKSDSCNKKPSLRWVRKSLEWGPTLTQQSQTTWSKVLQNKKQKKTAPRLCLTSR